MKNIGRKLKIGSRVLLIALLITLILVIAAFVTGSDGIKPLLALAGVTEESPINRFLPAALLLLAGLIVIFLIVWTVFAFGQAIDCLEDIADAQEESTKCLKTLIERVEHLPVLKLGDRESPENTPARQQVSFRSPQRVFVTRENPKPVREEESAAEKASEKPDPQPAAPVKSNAQAPYSVFPSESWRCPGCGQVNPAEKEICTSCGEKSLWKCSRCGAVNSYCTDVCTKCGTRDTRPCPHCGNILPRNRLICDVCHSGQ